MTTLSTKRGASRYHSYLFSMLLVLLAGCATTQPQSRPFFQNEQDLATHGRKTWYDQVLESDPGSASFAIAGDYQERPPRKIAVLPFADHGNGDYLVNKIQVKSRDEKERDMWAWTDANRVRRALTGDLATREFVIVTMITVDAVLADHGITNWDQLKAVPPEELGSWLGVDTVVYGELLKYEAYYGLLVSAWRVSASARMVSTIDGHEIFRCTDRRYSSTVLPAIDPIDMVINSVLSAIHLRDISLARTEYEVGREIVLSLPTAQRNISELQAAAKKGTRGLDSSSRRAAAPQESVRTDFVSQESFLQSPVDPFQ
jgi:hypothetical protein